MGEPVLVSRPALTGVAAVAPVLVFIVGPPAVGKMTVGHELAGRTGLKLFHNHHSIDLALRFFPFGTPPFHRLVGEFRRRIFEEVAASDLSGLIFTYVWAFDHASDDELQGACSSVSSHTRKEENGQSLASKAGAEESMGVEEIFEAGD